MPKVTELFPAPSALSFLVNITYAEFSIFGNGFFCKPKEGMSYFARRELVNVSGE
jgi:hypothetical protein